MLHRVIAVCLLLTISIVSANAQSKETWKGFAKNPSGDEVAFTLEVVRDGNKVRGALLNGNDRTESTDGSIEGNNLKLKFDYYDAVLNAVIDGDKLTGSLDRQWKKEILKRELRASKITSEVSSKSTTDKQITGEWLLEFGDAPKKSLSRAVFRIENNGIIGTVIPVHGDWGEMTGSFDNNVLTLYRFDVINSRKLLLKLTPQGKLEGYVDYGLASLPKRNVAGERITAKNKDKVASLPDPKNHTRMKNLSEPLRFSFPDSKGQLISLTDERYKNKVVIVSITGTWCPNCHEEAPMLQEFYDRYRKDGLEIVAPAFEYSGDAKRDMEQIVIFTNRHKLTYPVLLAGSLDDAEIEQKLPQLVNFGAYPTTIFIGRDGLVKRIHTGFDGKATGERFFKMKADFEETIKELLNGSLQ